MRRRRSTHGFDRSIDRSIDVDIHGFDRPLDRSIDRHPQARVYTMLGHSACTRRVSSFIVARAHAHGRIHRSSTRARARKVAGDTDTDTHTGCRRRRPRTPTGRTDGHAMGPSKWTTPRALKAAWTAFRGSVRARVIDCVID